METEHLRAALAVAQHGNFTLAARSLFVAQSTLSRQVSALERHLGVPLFVRGPSGVSTTISGRAFLVEAQAILGAIECAEVAARCAATRDATAAPAAHELRGGEVSSPPDFPSAGGVVPDLRRHDPGHRTPARLGASYAGAIRRPAEPS